PAVRPAPPKGAAPAVPAASAVSAASVVSAAIKTTPIKAAPEAPAVPGSDSDEQAVHEVIRSPIAVWGASVRRIIIVAIRTRWRAVGITAVTPADSNSHLNL